MNAEAEQLSARLRDELAANEPLSRDAIEAAQDAPRFVDTRQYPVRFHNLRETGKSPAHGRASFVSGYSPDSLATRIGAGTHAMMFDKPWIVYKGRRVKGRLKKDGTKTESDWDKFSKEHAGKVIMSPSEHAHAEAMCRAVKEHPIANRLLFGEGIVHEQTIEFVQGGRARRSTPDARGAFHITELKSARCVERQRFCRDAGYRGYAAQLADQCAAVQALTGRKPREAYIVAVESSWPHVVQVFQATDRALELGAHLCREWLDRLTLCEQTGDWPGYSVRIEALEVWEDFAPDSDEDIKDPPWMTDDA